MEWLAFHHGTAHQFYPAFCAHTHENYIMLLTVILDNLGAEIILPAEGEVVRSPWLALNYCLYCHVIKCVQTAGEIALILHVTWRRGCTEGCKRPADLNVLFYWFKNKKSFPDFYAVQITFSSRPLINM